MKSTLAGAMVGVALAGAVPAGAQDVQPATPAPAAPQAQARPVDRSELRHQVYVMEGALEIGRAHV